MAKHFTDPKGDLVAVAGLQNISYVPGKGVIGLNHQRKLVIWIDEADDVAGKAIRDKLIEMVNTRGRCGQPDWNTLCSKARKSKPENRSKKGGVDVKEGDEGELEAA